MRVLLIVLGFSFFTVGDAESFTILGRDDLEGWDREVLEFGVNYNEDTCLVSREKLEVFIDETMEVWNSVSSSAIKVKRGGTSTTTAATAWAGDATDYPLIICDASMGTTIGSSSTNSIPGVSLPFATGSRLNGGVVLLNSNSGDAANISALLTSNEQLIKVVVAHEIGHILGLGHTEDINALMYYNASLKENLRLGQDDIDGISYLYPRAEPVSDKLFGCGSVPGTSGLLSWLWVWLVCASGAEGMKVRYSAGLLRRKNQ